MYIYIYLYAEGCARQPKRAGCCSRCLPSAALRGGGKVYIYVYISIYLSIFLSIHIYLSIYPSIYLSMYLSIYVYI